MKVYRNNAGELRSKNLSQRVLSGAVHCFRHCDRRKRIYCDAESTSGRIKLTFWFDHPAERLNLQ